VVEEVVFPVVAVEVGEVLADGTVGMTEHVEAHCKTKVHDDDETAQNMTYMEKSDGCKTAVVAPEVGVGTGVRGVAESVDIGFGVHHLS
jgi:hypothetical protein